MNAAMMALLKKRNAKPPKAMQQDAAAEGETVAHEMGESPKVEKDEMSAHHKELRRHLEMGLSGKRRGAKVHLKLALHHHQKIMGDG